ncbi:MAG: lamin tail domain-containing protein [Patescibacteria group bacterium]
MPRVDSIRRLVSRILVAITIILTPLSGASAAPSPSPITIGEVAWAGSSASLADEWVELWNNNDTDVSLAGYSLRGGSDKAIFFLSDAVIPAKGTFIVSNYADTDTKSTLATTVQVVTSTVSLSNSVLGLSLWDQYGNQIDNAGTGTLPPAGTSGTPKATMIRVGDTWVTATISSGFDAGKTDLGTPGTCDGCTPMVIEEPEPPMQEPTPDPTPIPTPDPLPVATSTDPIPEQITTSTETVVPPIGEQPATTTEAVEPLPETPVVTEPAPTEESVPVVNEPEPILEPVAVPMTEPESQTTTTTSVEPVVESQPMETTPSSTITMTNEPVVAPPTAPQPSQPTTQQPSETPHYERLRLNEIMPNPDGESEWIEITSVDLNTAIPLQNVTLYDATGKIATVATGTVNLTTPFIRVMLSSSRLNNDGDTVTIHAPTGEVMDGLTYTYSEKGHSWIRIPDATGDWKVTLEPTPEDANVLVEEAPVPSPTPATTTQPSQTSSQTDATTLVSVTAPAPTPAAALVSAPILVTVTKPVTSTPVVAVSPSKAAPKPKASTPTVATKVPKASTPKKTTTTTTPKVKAPAKPKVTSTKKTTTTKKSTPLPTAITHAMANLESNGGIAVALTGTVGTPAGLLSGHYFILLSEDGRGLKVHVPTSKKLPNAGEMIRVVGVLSFSDEGVPSLGMRKDDPIETVTGLKFPEPRVVDLMTPGTEDAWSLVQVTGTVTAVKGQIVSLDLGDADINMVVKTSIGYRVSRLKVGDTLRVRALVQLGDIAPQLLPRAADDITVVGHVNIIPATTSSSSLPGWTPFAAAGAAVMGTEGLKRIRERYKQYRLVKRLQTGLNTPEPSLV